MTFLNEIFCTLQVRELGFDSTRHFGLDAVLLVVAQIGLMAYKIFTFIACCYATTEDEDSILVLLGALAALFQVYFKFFLSHMDVINSFSRPYCKRFLFWTL